MTEISFITQNGEQINLKDAKGRELLAEKQKKLIAGKGISISEDGIISAIGGASGSKVKELVIKDLTLSGYSGANYVYDKHIFYIGNPALVTKQRKIINNIEDWNNRYKDEGWTTADSIPLSFYGPDNTIDSQDVFSEFKKLDDTGEPFLAIVGGKNVITDRSFPPENIEIWGGEYYQWDIGDEKTYYTEGEDLILFTKARNITSEHDKQYPDYSPIGTLSNNKVFCCYTYNSGQSGCTTFFVEPSLYLNLLGVQRDSYDAY